MEEKYFNSFIGPKAENIELLKRLLNKVLDHHAEWRRSFYTYDRSVYPDSESDTGKLEAELEKFLDRSDGSIPYFHPRYAAQMLKDPSIATVLGYLTFMLSNPNNHAYEGGPVTTEMEMEVSELMLRLVGYGKGWGHLASGGSLANMESLWAVRDYYNGGTVFFSEVSHYSWKRICKILNIPDYEEIPVDDEFRMDLNVLEDKLKGGDNLMVMANLGSTGTGSVDNIEEILKLKNKYGFHLHVDAAYGGFFKSMIVDENYNLIPYSGDTGLSEFVYKQLEAVQYSDSITIDPHKQGLISYGAGAVLYQNEELRKIILNTAPYTYHKTDKPNIGMFSLEGSRPGAMAAACYLTYKILEPNINGVGKIVKGARNSAVKLYDMIEKDEAYSNLNYPDLDINCIYKKDPDNNVSKINEMILETYKKLSVEADNPEFVLSKFVLPPDTAARVIPGLDNPNNENFNALRIVFMKHWGEPEDYYYTKMLFEVLKNH